MLPRERVLDPTELAVLRAGAAAAGKVRFLAHYRDRQAVRPAPRCEPDAGSQGSAAERKAGPRPDSAPPPP